MKATARRRTRSVSDLHTKHNTFVKIYGQCISSRILLCTLLDAPPPDAPAQRRGHGNKTQPCVTPGLIRNGSPIIQVVSQTLGWELNEGSQAFGTCCSTRLHPPHMVEFPAKTRAPFVIENARARHNNAMVLSMKLLVQLISPKQCSVRSITRDLIRVRYGRVIAPT